MYFPRNNFSQTWYDVGNFGVYQPQNLNCSPAYFMANDSMNFTDSIRDRLGTFAERLSCYGMKAKDAMASVYCSANDKKEEIIDGFEELVSKFNYRNARTGNDWCIKDNVIDKFEELVSKFNYRSARSANDWCIKDNIIDKFEELVDKTKHFSLQTTNKLRRVTSVKETLEDKAVENFEEFVDKSKDLGLKGPFNLKKVESYRERAVDEFECLIHRLKSKTGSVEKNLYNNVEKVECLKDEVIDDFEGLVERLKTNINDFENNIKCFKEEKGEEIVEDFEELICRMRDFGQSILERTNDQVMKVNCVKDDIVDSFENLLTRLNEFGLRTDNEVRQKLDCVKEEIVDDFEDLVQRFFCNLKCVEDNLMCYTCEKQALIVDQFEEIIDDLKREINCFDLIIRGKVNQFFCELICFFEEMKCCFCEKLDVGVDFCSLKHWLCRSEALMKEFLCYSERMVEEFCCFSEKRVACFLCEGTQKAKVFYNEVVDSLVRGFEDKLLNDNLVLEINSSRYAYNVTMSEVNFHVVRALLTLPCPDGRSWQHIVSRLSYFMPILTNYIRSDAAQKDCLLAIEEVAGCHPEIFAVLVKIIHWLYERDILSEDIILDWYNHPCPDNDPDNSRRVRKQVAPFIRWLQEAEEDDDDDDD